MPMTWVAAADIAVRPFVRVVRPTPTATGSGDRKPDVLHGRVGWWHAHLIADLVAAALIEGQRRWPSRRPDQVAAFRRYGSCHLRQHPPAMPVSLPVRFHRHRVQVVRIRARDRLDRT